MIKINTFKLLIMKVYAFLKKTAAKPVVQAIAVMLLAYYTIEWFDLNHDALRVVILMVGLFFFKPK